MAIVVIAGGIDLSIAAMMAVASVTAAVLMDGAGDGQAALAVLFVLGLGVAMGAINGTLIVLTRVPDIVVTLAMLFVWQGVALLILNAPGGGAANWLQALIVGGVILPSVPAALTEWIPKSVIFLAVCVTAGLASDPPLQLGLAFYAIGSDTLAAFRSGVPVGANAHRRLCGGGALRGARRACRSP